MCQITGNTSSVRLPNNVNRKPIRARMGEQFPTNLKLCVIFRQTPHDFSTNSYKPRQTFTNSWKTQKPMRLRLVKILARISHVGISQISKRLSGLVEICFGGGRKKMAPNFGNRDLVATIIDPTGSSDQNQSKSDST
jgi:hypothetical protein